MEKNKYIKAAKETIEKIAGTSIGVLKDFETLSNIILQQTQDYISPTTLRRFWGYQEQSHLRPTSLGIIARYMGYTDWRNFCDAVDNGSSVQSGKLSRKRLLSESLTEGALVEVRWNPDRRIVVRFEGQHWFRIITAEKTKLHEGDRFRCLVFIENEPLYLTGLICPDEEPHDYVCGQRNGIRFWEVKE